MCRALKTMIIFAGALSPCLSQADQMKERQQRMGLPGEIVQEGQLSAGYNASASYKCRDGYDLYFTGDYILWNWSQESQKIGGVVPIATGVQRNIILDADYASGFQVGIGGSIPQVDNWNLRANYTWYQNTATNTATVPDGHTVKAYPFRDVSVYLLNGYISTYQRLKFNEWDLLIERPLYLGKRLIANVGGGLGSLWVVQKEHQHWSALLDIDDQIGYGSGHINAYVKSWSIGPKFVLDTSWLLGQGFAILANAAPSLFYTSYYDISYRDHHNITLLGITAMSPTIHTLRPVLQTFLGLGWDRGLLNDHYRLGFTAGFDFATFWDYDMMRFLRLHAPDSPDNMYLYGLNVQGRFDF